MEGLKVNMECELAKIELKWYNLASIAVCGEIGSGSIVDVAFSGVAEVPLPERFVHVLGGHALERIHADQSFDHVLALLGDVLLDVFKLSFAYLLE